MLPVANFNFQLERRHDESPSRPKVNELSESKQSILLLSFARLVLSSRAFVVGGL